MSGCYSEKVLFRVNMSLMVELHEEHKRNVLSRSCLSIQECFFGMVRFCWLLHTLSLLEASVKSVMDRLNFKAFILETSDCYLEK